MLSGNIQKIDHHALSHGMPEELKRALNSKATLTKLKTLISKDFTLVPISGCDEDEYHFWYNLVCVREQDKSKGTLSLLAYAFHQDDLSIIKWLIEDLKVVTVDEKMKAWLFLSAARCGSFEIFKWLCDLNIGSPVEEIDTDPDLLVIIGQTGQFNLFKWLIDEKNWPVDDKIILKFCTNLCDDSDAEVQKFDKKGFLDIITCLVQRNSGYLKQTYDRDRISCVDDTRTSNLVECLFYFIADKDITKRVLIMLSFLIEHHREIFTEQLLHTLSTCGIDIFFLGEYIKRESTDNEMLNDFILKFSQFYFHTKLHKDNIFDLENLFSYIVIFYGKHELIKLYLSNNRCDLISSFLNHYSNGDINKMDIEWGKQMREKFLSHKKTIALKEEGSPLNANSAEGYRVYQGRLWGRKRERVNDEIPAIPAKKFKQ